MNSALCVVGLLLATTGYAQETPETEEAPTPVETTAPDEASTTEEAAAETTAPDEEPSAPEAVPADAASGEQVSVPVAESAELANVTVLHINEVPDVVSKHVSVIAGVPASDVTVSTLSAFLRGQPTKLAGNADITICSGAPSTMSNIKDAIERSRGAIDLMEDNKAMAYLTTAVGGIGCLGESLNGEQASELYFLKGFLEHASGEEDKASDSFRRVHQLQSGLGWDNYFPPDAEPLFNQMAEEVAGAETANLNIVPTPAAGSVWLDGNPASVVGSQLRIPVGKHFIQFVGDRVLTYEVDIKGAGELELTVPGLLATNTMEWVTSQDKSRTYSDVFANMRAEGSTLYASFEGSIWSTTIGVGEWRELVAQGAADQAEILKSERYAKAPKSSGITLASIGGVFIASGIATLPGALSALNDYTTATQAYNDVYNSGDGVLLTQTSEAKREAQTAFSSSAAVTGTMTALGGIGLGFGVTLLKKAKLRRAELPPWHPYSLDLIEDKSEE